MTSGEQKNGHDPALSIVGSITVGPDGWSLVMGRPVVPRPRDAQRGRLYSWEEGQAWGRGSRKCAAPGPGTFPAGIDGALLPMDLDDAQTIVNLVFALGGVEPPQVLDGRGRRAAAFIPRGGPSDAIALPRWARTPMVVLHEIAHALEAHTREPREHHGPEFLATYIALLGIALGANPAVLRSSARAYGLRVGAAPEDLFRCASNRHGGMP